MGNYRIYVVSLSDYNAGNLHGVWIDCDGKDEDELDAEVRAMLRASQHPNVMVDCPVCVTGEYADVKGTVGELTDGTTGCLICGATEQVPSAEEYAIHDHEGFGELIGEHTPLSEVANIVGALESCDDPEALQEFAEHYGYDITEASDHFASAYCGQWDSEVAYAESYLADSGQLDESSFLASYFDYERFARDLFISDMTMTASGHVFHDHHC